MATESSFSKHPVVAGEGASRELWSRDLKVFKTLSGTLGQDNFVPLKVDNLAGGPPAPCPLYVKTIRAQGEVDYVPCCGGGEIFVPEWTEILQTKGIDRVYFQGEHQNRVLLFLHGNLHQIMRDRNLAPVQKASRVYDVMFLWSRQFFLDRRIQVSAQLLLALEYLDYLFICVEQDSSYQHWVLELCSFDGMLYTHCLNTSLIGLAFTCFLGWPRPLIRDFGLGALVHDIGLARLAPAMGNGPRRPGTEEIELFQRHPAMGYNLLKTYSALSEAALMVVQQHHEHWDGSGYPRGLSQTAISPEGRVMRIVDSFEALTFGRIRGEALSPVRALWLMREQWEQRRIYDTGYLSEFIKFLSI